MEGKSNQLINFARTLCFPDLKLSLLKPEKLCENMDPERRLNSTVPLISRLDHLDFIMKRLESKHDLPKWASRSSEIVPLDLAIGEVYCKGSLIDRVNSLEHRLLQLLLEIDSSGSSRTSKLTPSQDTPSSEGSKRELSGSSTAFGFPNLQPIREPRAVPPNNKPEIQVSLSRQINREACITSLQAQATSQRTVHNTKKSTAASQVKAQTRKSRAAGEANKSCKALNKRQQKPRASFYIRLLGC
ncbi:uncharacterized protein LOC116205937 isoform X1 [Punica granatum]|uniref:Uncharacterized protein LOC116205937 isoform X1 n=1 Tax=Punica granatum TaxID=22663 RepID=A0A6P8DBC0_PUNGR|nr:uncharacterized protein LOC116205937 isoform X1 [Punica granatum]